MRTSKKRRQHLRGAFVTTVASAAVTVIASGCQSKVSISCFGDECGQGGASSSQSTGPGQPAVCPEIVPVHGASCPEVGLSCGYENVGSCEPIYDATCAPDGRWEVETTVVSCNPPPCPAEAPVPGISVAGALVRGAGVGGRGRLVGGSDRGSVARAGHRLRAALGRRVRVRRLVSGARSVPLRRWLLGVRQPHLQPSAAQRMPPAASGALRDNARLRVAVPRLRRFDIAS